MRRALALLVCVGAFACDLRAQSVVVSDDIDFFFVANPPFGPGYAIDAPYAANTVSIRYDRSLRTVTPVATHLAYPETQLFVVKSGDLFNDANIRSGQFTKLDFFRWPGPASVPVGNSDFYLGIAQLSESSPDVGEIPGLFGWMHLRPTNIGNGLEMLENVVSYRTSGIFVGTTTIVPEPGYAVVVSSVLIAAIGRWRRRSPTRQLTSVV